MNSLRAFLGATVLGPDKEAHGKTLGVSLKPCQDAVLGLKQLLICPYMGLDKELHLMACPGTSIEVVPAVGRSVEGFCPLGALGFAGSIV